MSGSLERLAALELTDGRPRRWTATGGVTDEARATAARVSATYLLNGGGLLELP